MSTVLQRRDELIAALATVNPQEDPGAALPHARVYGGGVDLSDGVSRRQSPAVFRVVLLAGAYSQAASARALAGQVSTFLTAAATLAEWGVGTVQRDLQYDTAGGRVLGAECLLTAMVDY